MSISTRISALEKAATKRSRTQTETLNSIKDCIAPIYLPLYEDVQSHTHTFINLPGGRGSCKSSFVSLAIVDGIMRDGTGASNAVVFRRYASTLRESAYTQCIWAIDTLGASHLWRQSVSPMQLTYLPTGAQIVFRGLDDATKLKSIRPRKGVFRFAWFEEFAELPGENFSRNVLQSVMRGDGVFTVFRSFNPPISAANWANTSIAIPDERSITLHTSYLDVPPAWLGDAFICEAERLKAVNETAYRHEYLGEPTGSGGEVFPNIEVRQITDDEIRVQQYFYVGCDFGFATDPAAVVKLAYDRRRDTIYLIGEIYERHCSNARLAELIKSKKFDRVGTTTSRQTIICDAAEPKSVYDLFGMGLKAYACTKYPGSVQYDIKWLQQRKLIIDPKRTPNAYKEFTQYEYCTTKDGEFLADVPDRDNHTIDAARYALDRIINNSKFSA